MTDKLWCKSAIRGAINSPPIFNTNGGVSCGCVLVYTPLIPITHMGKAIRNYICQYKKSEEEQS